MRPDWSSTRVSNLTRWLQSPKAEFGSCDKSSSISTSMKPKSSIDCTGFRRLRGRSDRGRIRIPKSSFCGLEFLTAGLFGVKDDVKEFVKKHDEVGSLENFY